MVINNSSLFINSLYIYYSRKFDFFKFSLKSEGKKVSFLKS
nr:MAG TPA: hypothetical protein [Caudoviricetes sp.]